eukprot:s2340_g15.t1
MDRSLAAFLPKPEPSQESISWQRENSVRLPAPKVDSLPMSSFGLDSVKPDSSFASRVEVVRAPWSFTDLHGFGDSRIATSPTKLWPPMRHLAEAASDELDRLREEERSLRCLWQSCYSKQMTGGSARGALNGRAAEMPTAKVVDEAKTAEQEELANLFKQAEQNELQHHRAAEEWRQVYREVKDVLKEKQLEAEESQAVIDELQAEVSSLRSALKIASAELEDASAAYRATDARVTSERVVLAEELAEAKLAAEGARMEQVEAEEQRQDELRKELSECLQREALGQALLERLRQLRNDAETQRRHRDELLPTAPAKVDAACQSSVAEEKLASDPSYQSQTVSGLEPSTSKCMPPTVPATPHMPSPDQRQWLLSRVQKLHAVKDQLQNLRKHSLCTPEKAKSGNSESQETLRRWHKKISEQAAQRKLTAGKDFLGISLVVQAYQKIPKAHCIEPHGLNLTVLAPSSATFVSN